jgi:Putative heavy-metal-binding
MGFFRRGAGEDGRQAESLARIEDGGVPPRAKARLQALAAEGSLFTSGLSVNEFALLHRLGPQPLAQVMGASVVRTGWQYLPALEPGEVVISLRSYGPTTTGRALQNRMTEASPSQFRNYQWRTEVVCALDVLTDAWNLARRRALDRLAEEALEVGADAVVGVHLRRSDHDLGKGTIEYVVTGTAIRHPGSAGTARPMLSALSVQDYWRLHGAGHEPVGLIAATAVVFASPPRATRLRRLRTMARNQELGELSRGFQLARETVRSRLRGQVCDAHGEGAVGVEFSHAVHRDEFPVASALGSASQRGWHRGTMGVPYYVRGRSDADRGGWVITMHAAGTAVRRGRDPASDPVKTAIRIGPR